MFKTNHFWEGLATAMVLGGLFGMVMQWCGL